MTLQFDVIPGCECDTILSSIEYPSEGPIVVKILAAQ